MDIAYVKCPQCAQSFHCDAHLLELTISLHCPHCDLYFEPQGAEKKKAMGGTAFIGLAKIDRQIIYLPSSAVKKPRS
ncbi:MAG: hypothetical protein FJ117_05345 [Deltaproteobacteria bacterium]|nr:hypothetical protein [Deltaproteobacteria bacterium]